MVEYIRHRERVLVPAFDIFFGYVDPETGDVDTGGGYAFPCDAQGNPLFDQMGELGIENLFWCFSEEAAGKYEYLGIRDVGHSYMQNAIIVCDRCGDSVELSDNSLNDYNVCNNCGQGYNGFGQHVRCGLRDIDPLDAGERWDDEY